MNEKRINSLIGVIYNLSAILVIIGAFFKLQHYPHGLSILITGFMLGSIISWADKFRLKKKIKSLEEQLQIKDDL
ncbi:GldL-related protein [Sunxiuqinia dokdonensis]|uniref:Gliding motility protein GldL-like N-terminal domain-containing protein n=1 Tax=Sunxiuqinia dokdonensis TaxID=1409788 RepID=A0A0L8V4B3_9BACT|nr:hypothetical protein [Sunxiuqinia dokdonensis]KOH43183.1 hypothetical protein NC99_40070 [Sunxiuqinia dokdonensis]